MTGIALVSYTIHQEQWCNHVYIHELLVQPNVVGASSMAITHVLTKKLPVAAQALHKIFPTL